MLSRTNIVGVTVACALLAETIVAAVPAHAAPAQPGLTTRVGPSSNLKLGTTVGTSLHGEVQLAATVAAQQAIDAFAAANPWIGSKVSDLQGGPNSGYFEEFNTTIHTGGLQIAKNGVTTGTSAAVTNLQSTPNPRSRPLQASNGKPLVNEITSVTNLAQSSSNPGSNIATRATQVTTVIAPDATVYYDQAQVTEVHGLIRDKYLEVGGPTSFLGYPLTIESGTPDGVGRYNHFQGGSIYWNKKTSAHVVDGAIRDEWASLGWERSALGYPLTDETTTPDRIGRYNHFQGGSIYWSPDTGAHEVQGAIRDQWASLGWEQSYLGYPISDEHDCGSGARCSTFQRGTIRWTSDGGAMDTSGVYYVHLDRFHIDNTRARHLDTDYATLNVKVEGLSGTAADDSATWGPNDVNNGDHTLGLTLGPYTDPPDDTTQLGFAYTILNNGNSSAPKDTFNAMITVGSAAAGAAIGAVLAGPPGSAGGAAGGAALGALMAVILTPLTNIAFANCDGIVAQDEFGFSGPALMNMTAASGSYSEQHHYPGTDSPAGCGSNSDYSVSWTISRG